MSLSDAELHVVGGEIINADVASITVTDTLTADYDTDKDGIGNETDTDDDNDSVSDVDEKTRGTNSLVANPKPKEIVEESKEVEKVVTETPHAPKDTEAGLEQFLDAGTADTLLGNVTDKVANAKQSLDTYRAERNMEIAKNAEVIPESPTKTPLGTYTEGTTITRSKIEKDDTFLSSFVSGTASMLQKVWTFILWALSNVLAHAAIIQLALLIGILYGFYRMARRIGRRPN